MKLSIIVPVYNMASDGKLNFCLDSLIGQTLITGSDAASAPSMVEIIPVDDASTDTSRDILAQYAKQYPNLIFPIYSPENRRQGGAKNLGLEKAQGEWVGFIDSDDWIAPDMYRRMLQRAEDTGADVVGCQYCITHEHSMTPGETVMVHNPSFTGPMTDSMKDHFIRFPGSLVVKVYKRSVIEENHLRFPEHTFYEDNQAGPLWMLCFSHFELIDEPLYYYYQHQASTVHTINMDRLHNRMDMAAGLIEEAGKRGHLEKHHAAFEGAFTRIYYVNTLFSYVQESKHFSMSFLQELRAGMRKYFPAFQENETYDAEYDAEQKKLISLHMKNPLLFTMYYQALRFYRRIRYGK